MSTRKVLGDLQQTHRASPMFPPQELWLHDPYTQRKLATPVDSRGLVDIPALVQLVTASIDPSHEWKGSAKGNKHHLYFYEALYPHKSENASNKAYSPHHFRELAINKIMLPEEFHTWLHMVTDRPPVPDREIQVYRIEAQRVVYKLFDIAIRGAWLAHHTSCRKVSILEDELLERFEEYHRCEEMITTIPSELRIVEPGEVSLTAPSDFPRARLLLGRLARTASSSGYGLMPHHAAKSNSPGLPVAT